MDDYWQMKWSSTLQPTTLARSSSSQLQPQESRNQIMDAGHYFYTQVGKQPSPASRGMIQESICFKNPYLSSYNPGHAELGSSFLSLLSGPPSILQSELQNSSVPKKFITNSGFPVSSNSVVVSAARNGVSVAPVPTGPLSESLWSVNSKIGANLHSKFSSRAVGSANCGRISSLQDRLQAENLNLQGSELSKAVLFHDIIPGGQKVNDLFPLGERMQTASSTSNAVKLTNVDPSQKVPFQAKSSVCLQSSSHAIGYPRVFCLGASGDLLLSSTGLLGVVCSCHGWHMSVSKFCEHSGLFDINPGNAVRVDSGETIAQWRKMYFFKFGIRVPEDQSGWDWPEGFSATANLVKHGATLPNMSKNLDLSYLSGSPGAFVGSGKSLNNRVPIESPLTGHNLVNEGFHNEKQRNAQEGCNFLHKGLDIASQINLHPVGHGQIMECPISGSMVPKLAGKRTPYNDCQLISSHTDSACRIGNLFISSPNLKRSKTLVKDSNISRFNSSRVDDIRGVDAVPSNIELRLGQPSQQSQTEGNSNLPVSGSHQFYTHGISQKSILPEQPLHNSSNSMVLGECKQYLQGASNRFNSSARKEHSLLNVVSDASGVSNAIDATKMEQLKDDAARGSIISMLLSHLKTPEERLQFNSEHVMPKTHCESQTAKHDQDNFPWSRGNGTERKLIVNELSCHKPVDKGKGVGCVTDGRHVATESVFPLPTKQVEHSTPFSAVVNGSGDHSCSAVAGGHDKSSHSHWFSGLTPDASDAKKPSGYSGKISCLGCNAHFGHGFLRSINSSMDSGPILLSQSIPVGLSATTSFSVPNPTSTLPNKECIGISPYSLNDNVKNVAFRHALESSGQDHAFASSGTNHGKGRFMNSFGVNMHGSNLEPSLPKDLNCAPDITSKKDIPELAMNSFQSGAACWMSGDCEKLAPVAGLNRWSNFSTSLQTTSVHPKGLEAQFQLCCDLCPNELPSLRYGSSEHIINPLREHGNCCQGAPYTYLPDKCSCAIHVNHLIGNCDFEGKTAIDAIEEHAGSSDGKASLLFASKIIDQYSSPKEKASLDQNAKLDGQVPKKIVTQGFYWRDVPRRIPGSCNVTCRDQPADLSNGKVNVEDQITDLATKRFERSTQNAECLKEPEMSNISSGCSAPAVTQASIEVNNMDSCTVDTGNTRSGKDLVVDEGSGIDKCWSSDDALDSKRSSEFFECPQKMKSLNEKPSKELPNLLSCSLIDELRFRDSFRCKNVRNQIHSGTTELEKIDRAQKSGRSFKTGKRKRATKWKTLDASFLASGTYNDSPKCISSAEWDSCLYNDVQKLLQHDERVSRSYICSTGQSFKRRRSGLSSSKNICRKRDLHKLYSNEEGKSDYRVQLRVNDDSIEIVEASGRKKFKSGLTALTAKQFRMQKPDCADVLNCNSVDRAIFSSNQTVSVCKSKERPIVCGKYGTISNGDLSKPAKIVPLRKILKVARTCTVTKGDGLRLTSVKEFKENCSKGNKQCFSKFSSFWKEREIEANDAMVCTELDLDNFMEEAETASFSGVKECNDVLHILEKERHDDSAKIHSIRETCSGMRLKTKYKEVRKRSLYELTIEGKGSTCANLPAMKIPNSAPQTKCRYLGKFLNNAESAKCHVDELYNARKSTEGHQCHSPVLNLDAFCCVCGSPNKDEVNCLLECNRCLIRVHQACYGVSKVPKNHWYCRPCRTSSKNIVCVLCGYGGGAMTRAIQSRNIVKSLLKAWNVVMESRYENSVSPSEAFLEDKFGMSTSRSVLQSHPFPVIRHVDNSITAGVLDSTVKQWVHMVCGLWTPGTRCPNVDTMSAFDVSGASRPKVNVVCSMCNRPGGSCIKCRVLGCSIQFHPWCAHQKGLLQSEVEGIDNENVGFYGRCVIHAACHHCDSDGDPVDDEISCLGEREGCARTEGFKGRKQEGFQHRLSCQFNGNGGCLVPQEQLNAWLHINGQKSCTKGLLKLPISDIEHDCRKEYTRYKQSKGWKHLVVYKSGIHALGLYTSQFISRGAMVVEYVGEIVGLRVADKRESEYQSGRKVQYKSACYFFRIDKEHIIDATRKGGIARFVNHSCLPNCVAKVISVRTEKKVVFFAERDIYPGEEITYDYHFNHEDEGKKIPCFCNSKNCRRYLN